MSDNKDSIFELGDTFNINSPFKKWDVKDSKEEELQNKKDTTALRSVSNLDFFSAFLSKKFIYNIILSPPFSANPKLAFETGDFAMTSMYFTSLLAEKISKEYLDGLENTLSPILSKDDDMKLQELLLAHKFFPPSRRPAIMHNIVVNDPEDAYNKIKELKDEGHYINNLIIDSHGTSGDPSFAIGGGSYHSEEDILNFWGRYRYSDFDKKKPFSKEKSDERVRRFGFLHAIGTLIKGDIILNACYSASEGRPPKDQKKKKKNGHDFLKKITRYTKCNVYGTASWFISNPIALLNVNEDIMNKLKKDYPKLESLFDLIKAVGPIPPAGVDEPTYYSYKKYHYEYDNMGVWYMANYEKGSVEKLPGYLYFLFNGEIGISDTQWLETPIGLAFYAFAVSLAKEVKD